MGAATDISGGDQCCRNNVGSFFTAMVEIQHDVMVDGIQFWMTIVDFLFRSGGGSKLEGVWYLG